MSQNMESDILTVSLGSWMDLPGLTMSEWSKKEVGKRINVSMVANYYKEYVRAMGLDKNFVNFAEVTDVRKVEDYSSLWQETNVKRCCVFEECMRTRKPDPHHKNVDGDEVFRFEEEPFTIKKRSSLGSSSASSVECCSTVTPRAGSPTPLHDVNDDGYDEEEEEEEPETCALSATPAGILMIERARQRAMTKCCLKFAQLEADDPIVNPSLFQRSFRTAAHSATCCLNRKTMVRSSSLGGGELEMFGRDPDANHLWEVSGIVVQDGEASKFRYLTRNVVLACGSDKPNTLSIPGENLPFVLHSLSDLEGRIASADVSPGDVDPVLIVGAGLSAADAVIAAMENELKVVHMFRRQVDDKGIVFRNLPRKVYPEYHEIHKAMREGVGWGGRYRALERQHLMEIFPDRTVKFHGESKTEVLKVSYVLVLIGARPDLSFLQGEELSGEVIGVVPDSPISKTNPVDINIYSCESVKHKGLYAMGPLVGDNFVRFLQGGALAITNDILMKRRHF